VPLTIVLAITALKEIFEDLVRTEIIYRGVTTCFRNGIVKILGLIINAQELYVVMTSLKSPGKTFVVET
jgi:hypothetical protein